MTINFEAYLTEVRPDVPGCPENTMINAVRNAAIELCEKSRIWRETLAPIDVVQGEDQYQLTSANTQALVNDPVHVAYDGRPLSGKTEEELDRIDRSWRTADENPPQCYLLGSGAVLWLNRKPDLAITGGLVVRVSLKPAPGSDGADDFIYNDWHEAIAHGAKRRLMEIPEKKWTNLALARFHGQKFTYFINQALAKADKGNLRQASYVQIPQW